MHPIYLYTLYFASRITTLIRPRGEIVHLFEPWWAKMGKYVYLRNVQNSEFRNCEHSEKNSDPLWLFFIVYQHDTFILEQFCVPNEDLLCCFFQCASERFRFCWLTSPDNDNSFHYALNGTVAFMPMHFCLSGQNDKLLVSSMRHRFKTNCSVFFFFVFVFVFF